jgi:hypothetical protein
MFYVDCIIEVHILCLLLINFSHLSYEWAQNMLFCE